MMFFFVLKGHHILAQGEALGKKGKTEIVS